MNYRGIIWVIPAQAVEDSPVSLVHFHLWVRLHPNLGFEGEFNLEFLFLNQGFRFIRTLLGKFFTSAKEISSCFIDILFLFTAFIWLWAIFV